MENNKPNNKEEMKKGTDKKPRAPEVTKDVTEKWNAIKKFVGGERTLSKLEEHLIMHNNEALKMDPTPPTYPATRMAMQQLLPLGVTRIDSMYIPCQADP